MWLFIGSSGVFLNSRASQNFFSFFFLFRCCNQRLSTADDNVDRRKYTWSNVFFIILRHKWVWGFIESEWLATQCLWCGTNARFIHFGRTKWRPFAPTECIIASEWCQFTPRSNVVYRVFLLFIAARWPVACVLWLPRTKLAFLFVYFSRSIAFEIFWIFLLIQG